MASKRMLQVGEQIREHVATMLARGEVSDPRVKNVTINAVKMTADLQTARVYYSVLGEASTKEAVGRGLKQAAGFLRHTLGEALRLRYTPELHFFYDESVERAAHMNALLATVRKEWDTSSHDESPSQAGSDAS